MKRGRKHVLGGRESKPSEEQKQEGLILGSDAVAAVVSPQLVSRLLRQPKYNPRKRPRVLSKGS